MSRFPSPFTSTSSGRDEHETQLKDNFDQLVTVLLEKYRGGSRAGDALNLPESIEDILKQYEVVHPLATIGNNTGKLERIF